MSKDGSEVMTDRNDAIYKIKSNYRGIYLSILNIHIYQHFEQIWDRNDSRISYKDRLED